MIQPTLYCLLLPGANRPPAESWPTGIRAHFFPTADLLWSAVQDSPPEFVLLALPRADQPGRSAVLELAAAVAARSSDPEILVWVAETDAAGAALAQEAGAQHLLVGQLAAPDLAQRLERARRRQTARQALKQQQLEAADGPLQRLVGDSPALLALKARLPLAAAAHPATILIRGESGTGKELVARALHALSPRSSGPFVAINCACLPDELLEAELFGAAQGAYTGARAGGRLGLLAAAQGGTLFLDEVGELSAAAQAKLLRFLQERRYRRLGENSEQISDARLFAATHANLEAGVEAGTFRADLYYRLNVLQLEVPALRERLEDLPVLAAACLERIAREQAQAGVAWQLTAKALEALAQESWPGNVRELENRLRRAALLSPGPSIDAEAVSAPSPKAALAQQPGRGSSAAPTANLFAAPAQALTLAELERLQIAQVLQACGQNKSLAARQLGLHRSTLYAKLKSLELDGRAA
jgi:DNA-binding NtrC family response regulator